MSDRSRAPRAPKSGSTSIVSESSESQTPTSVSDISYDNLPSWGADSLSATAIDPSSSVDVPALGGSISKKNNCSLCRHCSERGHLGKDCPTPQDTDVPFSATTGPDQCSSHSTIVYRPNPPTKQYPPLQLLDFEEWAERIPGPKNPDGSDDENKNESMENYKNKDKKNKQTNAVLHQPRQRAKRWTELDLKSITERAKNEPEFVKPLAEPTLMDGDPLTGDDAKRLANSVIPVELKRKHNGGKGEAYYDLSPFVHY